jgi:hypothetical protein
MRTKRFVMGSFRLSLTQNGSMKSPKLTALFLGSLFSLDAAGQVAKLPPGTGAAGSPGQATPVGQSNATVFVTNRTQPMLQFDIHTTNQFGQLTNPFGLGINSAGSGAGQFGFGTNPIAFDTNFFAVDTNELGSLAPGNRILLNRSGQFDISVNTSPFLLTNQAGTTILAPTGFTNFPSRIFTNPTNMLQLNPNSQ